MSNKEDKNICIICGCKYEGWGNNPEPLMSGGRCCDSCNIQLVLPARIRILKDVEERK